MHGSWKIAGAGAIAGAVLAVAIIFAGAFGGYLPVSGPGIHNYLMTHPELLAQMSDRYQSQQQAAQDKAQADAIKKLGLKSFFDPKLAFITGPVHAKKTLVEFYDYDCPYCRASLPAMEKYYKAHKNDTRFAFIEFPLPAAHGPSATLAARASLAARQQPDKFTDFYFTLMAEDGALSEQIIMADAAKAGLDIAKLKTDMKNPDIAKTIAASHKLADKAGINGTPTFILNGKMVPGALDFATLDSLMKG